MSIIFSALINFQPVTTWLICDFLSRFLYIPAWSFPRNHLNFCDFEDTSIWRSYHLLFCVTYSSIKRSAMWLTEILLKMDSGSQKWWANLLFFRKTIPYFSWYSKFIYYKTNLFITNKLIYFCHSSSLKKALKPRRSLTFMDLNEDCHWLVIEQLKWSDLFSLVEAEERIAYLASIIFNRKFEFANKTVVISNSNYNNRPKWDWSMTEMRGQFIPSRYETFLENLDDYIEIGEDLGDSLEKFQNSSNTLAI